jgi:hypothetical protein
MKNVAKALIVGFALALIFLSQLRAQTAAKAPAGANATAANITPTGQAPDDVMKRLSDLVHAGKYAEAQQTVAALLILYPDDQRLVKAKVLLDTAYVTAGAPSGAPSANPPTSNVASPQSVSNLAGMDKVDYSALVVLVRQAQQTDDLSQQNTLLRQFMDQSALFLQKHPNEMILWELRAESAISLNDPMPGYEAGQKLLAAGAADSSDTNLQQLLAQLKNKGWLDKKGIEDKERQAKFAPVLGTWRGSFWAVAFSGGMVKADDVSYEFSKSGSVIEAHVISGAGVKPGPWFKGTIIDSGEVRWEILSPRDGWKPATSWEIGEDKTMMKVVYVDRKNKSIEWSFRRIDGTH